MHIESKWEKNKSIKKHEFLEQGFKLFTEKGIDAVTLQDVADASGYGIATLYRYFSCKMGLLVEISSWKWEEFFQENQKHRPKDGTAAEMFDFYLESFLTLYRNKRPLLRFNQLLNAYIQSENVDAKMIETYRALAKTVEEYFHVMYEKAREDHTLRTDVSETEVLSVTLHLMLAAVSRYAVGLAYKPKGFNPVKELRVQKEMLYDRYALPQESEGRI